MRLLQIYWNRIMLILDRFMVDFYLLELNLIFHLLLSSLMLWIILTTMESHLSCLFSWFFNYIICLKTAYFLTWLHTCLISWWLFISLKHLMIVNSSLFISQCQVMSIIFKSSWRMNHMRLIFVMIFRRFCLIKIDLNFLICKSTL